MASAAARAFSLAALVGGVTVAAIGIGFAAFVGSRAVPILPLTALLLLGSKPVLDRAAHWAVGARGRIVTAAALLGAAPAFFSLAWYDMSRSLISSGGWAFCGTGDFELLMLLPLALFAWMGLSTLLSIHFLGPNNRTLDAALGPVSVLIVVAGALTFGAAMIRAARFPDPDHWVDAQPVTARAILDVGPPAPAGGEHSAPTFEGERAVAVHTRVELGGIALESNCNSAWCRVKLTPASEAEEAPRESRAWTDVAAGRTVLIHHDEAHHLWVLDGGTTAAYCGKTLARCSVAIATIASTASAPRGWMAGLGAGLGVAALARWRRRKVARRLKQLAEAPEGVLGDNGWVTFEAGAAPLRAPAGLAVGPVTLLRRGAAKGTLYRSDGPGDGATLVRGTRAEHEASARRRIDGLDVVTVAAVAVTSAPMVAAALKGLVC